MKRISQFILCYFFAACLVQAAPAEQAAPRVFLLDAKFLQMTRQQLRSGDKALAPAMAELERDAQAALKTEPYTIVKKGITPPSGDKHDYMSMAPYFWPDPASSNGLPYIRHDGETNPEIRKIPDHHVMDEMAGTVETLALAYYFKGDETYAIKATQLLRAWFLDPATRMNSNMQFAQAVTGVNTGRGIGIIEGRCLTRVVDAIGLLEGSKAWTAADGRGVKEWFGKFLTWMQESANGKAEAAAKNNHGTHYDVQATSYALFIGKNDLAKSILETARQKRIAVQVEPDGSQPLELARTKSWGYSTMNLGGLMALATLGDSVGVDLWNYRTADGRSIRLAFDYLMPYALGDKQWTNKQIGGWHPQGFFPLMRRAALKYPDGQYQAKLAKIPGVESMNRVNLLSPGGAVQTQPAAKSL